MSYLAAMSFKSWLSLLGFGAGVIAFALLLGSSVDVSYNVTCSNDVVMHVAHSIHFPFGEPTPIEVTCISATVEAKPPGIGTGLFQV